MSTLLPATTYGSLEEAVGHVPPSTISSLELLNLPHLGFDGKKCTGQLVVRRALSDEVREIFDELLWLRFPIQQMIPILHFQNSDEASMAANNTSAFNLRFVAETTVESAHAKGLAIDLNPMQNPCIYGDGRSVPAGAVYRPDRAGTFYEGSKALEVFLVRGWIWGGRYTSLKDYHHFEKPE